MGPVKDLEAVERKIRPIYDALDSQNWKTAIKLSAAALQKYPDNDLIKTLKALALLRSGKRDEAGKLCDEVLKSSPTDEVVLRTFVLVLKDLHRTADITRAYEAAAEKDPRSQEVATGLFGAYVREQNYRKQQQLAMKLHKLHGGERFLWWAVLSIILQATPSSSPLAPSSDAASSNALDSARLVQLAESMVSRQASKAGGRLESTEALLVYLDMLLAQGKVKPALELVTGPPGDVVTMPAERAQLRAVLSALDGDVATAAALLEGQLTANPDDWGTLQLYFDCVLPGSRPACHDVLRSSSLLGLSGGLLVQRHATEGTRPTAPVVELSKDEVPAALSRATATVQSLIASIATPRDPPSAAVTTGGTAQPRQLTMRGPHLAEVELAARRVALKASRGPRDLAESALAYVERHGGMVSCALDLRPAVVTLEGEERSWLAGQLALRYAPSLARFLAVSTSSSTPSAESADLHAAVVENGTRNDSVTVGGGAACTDLRSVRLMVCTAQLLDDLALPRLSSPAAALDYASALMRIHSAAAPLSAGLDERERGPVDELPPLAAAALVSGAAAAASAADAVVCLLQATVILTAAVEDRPYSGTMRIALTALSTLLGLPGTAHEHMMEVDIKHIQLDTLGGHLLLPALLAFAAHGDANAEGLLRSTLTLFDDHKRDAPETMLSAYRHGAYSKVLEFVAFKTRLHSAHTRAVTRAEQSQRSVAQVLLRRQGTAQQQQDATAAICDACTALPLAEMPDGSSSSSSSSSSSPDDSSNSSSNTAVGSSGNSSRSSSSLRFNEDLATRPSWLPPCGAGAHLAPATWWEGRAGHSGQGLGRRWWCIAGAAESDRSEAAALRQYQVHSLRRRWLLPHLLAEVTSPPRPKAAAAAHPTPASAAAAKAAPSTSATATTAATATSCSSSSAASALAALSLSESPARSFVSALAATFGVADVSGLDAATVEQQQQGRGSIGQCSAAPSASASTSSQQPFAGSGVPLSQRIERLSLYIFAAGEAVQAALSAAPGSLSNGVPVAPASSSSATATGSTEAVAAAASAAAPAASAAPATGGSTDESAATAAAAAHLRRLQGAVDSGVSDLCAQLEAEVGQSVGVLPGGTLALLSALLAGPLAWLSFCLEAWLTSARGGGKAGGGGGGGKKKGKAAVAAKGASSEGSTPSSALVAQLLDVRSAVASSLTGISSSLAAAAAACRATEALAARLSEAATTCGVAASHDGSSASRGATVRAAVQTLLDDVVKEQGGVITFLQQMASSHINALTALE